MAESLGGQPDERIVGSAARDAGRRGDGRQRARSTVVASIRNGAGMRVSTA